MLYEAIERAAAVVTANFSTRIAALATAQSLTGLDTTATVFKRRDAADLAAQDAGGGHPVIGIYGLGVRTNAKRQTVRDSRCRIVLDYYARGKDAVKVEQQCELAMEALCGCIDQMGINDPTGTFGAGEGQGDIDGKILRLAQVTGEIWYEERVMVEYTQWERDTGL